VAPEFTPYFDFGNGGSMLEWIPAMDRILALDFDTVIPGHGPVSTRADVEKWRADLITVRDRLRAMLKQGASRADLEKMLIADYRWPAGGLALGQLDALVAEIRQ
jgi:glyoxylase-like metal-dependent hydrolase (beta-lactamase superfamily II)